MEDIVITLHVVIEREIVNDSDGDLSYLEQDCFNEDTGEPDSVDYGHKRIAAYNDGDWWFVGVRAVARSIETGHVIAKSGGLWGIESDSGDDYLDEVFEEERTQLLHDLNLK